MSEDNQSDDSTESEDFENDFLSKTEYFQYGTFSTTLLILIHLVNNTTTLTGSPIVDKTLIFVIIALFMYNSKIMIEDAGKRLAVNYAD